MKLKGTIPWKKSYDQPRQHIKKERHYFADKDLSSQSCVFSSSHVWMWEMAYKESWVPKSWCLWTLMLEKTLESLLDCKEIQPVNPKGISPEYSLEGLMLKWNSKNLATWYEEPTHWKRPEAGKDWKQEKKEMTEDEMVGWHHRLDGHELEQALGVGDGQGSLVCFSPWGCKESDTTERLNWTESISPWSEKYWA